MSLFFRQFLRSVTFYYYQPKYSIFVSSALKIFINNEKENAFILKLPEGLAHVTYRRLNGVIELQHTYVPVIFRGKGIAAALAKEIFNYCLRNEIKVKLSCWYLQSYYNTHSAHYKSIVV